MFFEIGSPMRLSGVIRESCSSARATRGFSLTIGILSALAAFLIIMLSGVSSSQRDEVVGAFSTPDLRTVTIVDKLGKGVLSQSMRDSIGSLSAIEAFWFQGPAFEVHNGANLFSGRASAKMYDGLWDSGAMRLISGRWPDRPGEAVLALDSAAILGIDDSGGWIESDSGRVWSVVGTYDPLHSRAPNAVLMWIDEGVEARSLSFTTADVGTLDTVVSIVSSLADSVSNGELLIDRADESKALQNSVSFTITKHGAVVIFAIMSALLLVLCLTSLLMVNSRKREFGRRRALGATRSAIVALVLTQGTVVILPFAFVGVSIAIGSLALRDQSVSWMLVFGLLLTIVCGAVLFQVPSAVVAGLRDPVKVLRSP